MSYTDWANKIPITIASGTVASDQVNLPIHLNLQYATGVSGTDTTGIFYNTVSSGVSVASGTYTVAQNDGIFFNNHILSLNAGTCTGGYDSIHATCPCVIKESATSYKMWYAGYGSGANAWVICYTTSTNGINWTTPVITINKNNITHDVNGCSQPYVIKDTTTNTYKMWYVGYNSGSVTKICYATSSNGTTWSGFTGVVGPGIVNQGTYDTAYCGYHCVIKESDNSYKMWYGGYDGTNSRILYCTSTDGITWSNFQLSVDMANIPRVLKESSNSYKLWYAAGKIAYATSTDGITWADKQFILNNNNSIYDSSYSMFLCIIKDTNANNDTLYRAWYEGFNGAYAKIMYTTSLSTSNLQAKDIVWTGHNLNLTYGYVSGYDSSDVAAPCIIKDGSTYKMWYSGLNTYWRGMYAISYDGFNWFNHQGIINVGSAPNSYDTNGVFTPCVIKESDTSYKMWYGGYDGTYWRIIYCTSSNGISWSNFTTSLNRGASGLGYDSSTVAHPWVIKESSNSYKMWYTGNDGSYQRTLYATSTDGITWSNFQLVIDKGAQGVVDTQGVVYPYVMKENSTYKMWYTSLDSFGGYNQRIIYCTSNDGITWSNHQLVLNRGAQGVYDTTNAQLVRTVLKDNGIYRLWYTSYDGTHDRIIHVQSAIVPTVSNGTSWGNFTLAINKGTQGIYDTTHAHVPYVIKDGNVFKMWYNGYNGTNWRILYTTSLDGITWTTPILSVNIGSQGTYDTTYAYASCIIKESDTSYKMWYAGSNNTNVRIIYCTSTNGIQWNNFQLVININFYGALDSVQVTFPSVIKESSTSYKMWYAAYNGTNFRILYAISIDGINWTNPQVVINYNQTAYDTIGAATPRVLKESNGYKMWYEAYNGTNSRILYAASTDGISWSTPQLVLNKGAQGTYDTSYTIPGGIVKDGSVYHMWYTGNDGTNSRILHCVSDGSFDYRKKLVVTTTISGVETPCNVEIDSWDPYTRKAALWTSLPTTYSAGASLNLYYDKTKSDNALVSDSAGISTSGTQSYTLVLNKGLTLFDTANYFNATVIYDSYLYKMWVDASDGTYRRVAYTTSVDGITWATPMLVVGIKSQGSYDTSYACAPYVLNDNGLYRMWYTGYDGTTNRVLYCTSTNGTTWSGFSLTINKAFQGTYDLTHSMYPCVIKFSSNSYGMWYTGYNATYGYSIIYCSSTDGITWSSPQTCILASSLGFYDTSGSFRPYVLYNGSNYQMWYSSFDGTYYRIVYCTSSNGINWSNFQLVLNKNSQGTYDTNGVVGPSILQVGSLYKMWYHAYDGTNNRILYTSSYDPKVIPPGQEIWVNKSNIAVLHMSQDPSFTTIKDSTPNIAHATMNGTATSTQLANGKIGKCLSFNGSNNYLSIPDSDAWYFGTGSFMIDCWVLLTNTTASNLNVSIYQQYVDANNYLLISRVGSSNVLSFVLKSSSTTLANYYFTHTATLGQWQHWAVTRSGTSVVMYINGVAQTTTTGTAISTNAVPNLAASVYIGYDQVNSKYSTCYIDEWRISRGGTYSSDYVAAVYASGNDSLLTYGTPVSADFTINSITPASGTTLSGFSQYLSINATITPSGTYTASFYDGLNNQIGTTVTGTSGNTLTSTSQLSCASGTSYWYAILTCSGLTYTTSTYNYNNYATCSGYVENFGTIVSGSVIYLHSKDTGALIGKTTTNASGTFSIITTSSGYHYCIATSATDSTIDAQIYDWLTPSY